MKTRGEDKKAEMIFSAKFACPLCGYNLQELEPRLFSFNNPAGACPECEGIGSSHFFDPERVINQHLSLSAGAIRGWDRRNAYYFGIIQSLAKHYDFDTDIPFQELPEKIKKILMYGSGSEQIQFNYPGHAGRKGKQRTHRFEGVLHTMDRRYRETESTLVREELAKFLSIQPCPECHGTRLNEAARHVFIQDKTLAELTAMPIQQAFDFFDDLQLAGHRGEIAKKINREISIAVKFPGQCRPRLPDAGSQLRHPVRRRSTAYPSRQPDRRRPGGCHVYPR